jgi:outer membrane receptor protein involved in Fe transport
MRPGYLDEATYSGKLDWLTPLRFRREGDVQLKVGGLARVRRREFDARLFTITPPAVVPDGLDVLALPPGLLVTPENLGRNVMWGQQALGGLPYDAIDDVYAGYAMVDVTPLERIRLVGGVRAERWKLFVEVPNVLDASRDNLDWLWSANATYRLTDSQNLRASAFRSVSRPDPREVSITKYSEVTNECAVVGNPRLQRARIDNADVRWEWFPSPGELISLSGFWKRFADPFIQIVGVSSLSCLLYPDNADSAINYGAELDIRRSLGFLADALEPLAASINVTYIDGRVIPKASNNIGDAELPLIDQSSWLANGALTWMSPDGGFEASVLGQFVGDRVRRYGDRTYDQASGGYFRTPDSTELGRLTIDARISKSLGSVSVSLSGRNLTAEPFEAVQQTLEAGALPTAYEAGVRSFSLSLGYQIW